jgi:hypothetical protein
VEHRAVAAHVHQCQSWQVVAAAPIRGAAQAPDLQQLLRLRVLDLALEAAAAVLAIPDLRWQ